MSEVLIVEDDQAVARSIGRALSMVSYAVDLASTLAVARAKVRERGFDALVLDIQLPDGNGLFFARELRSTATPIAIVVLSAGIDAQAALDIADLQALALPKPAECAIIQKAVARATTPDGEVFSVARHFAAVHRLSGRETDVLLAAASGLDPRAQAEAIGCTDSTLATFWHRIVAKCGVHSRQAVLAALVRHYEQQRVVDARVRAVSQADQGRGRTPTLGPVVRARAALDR